MSNPSSTSSQNNRQADQPSRPRPARSKNGCLTCRRRKVRCDEHRPRCAHCERLNLQCRWRPSESSATRWRFVGNDPASPPGLAPTTSPQAYSGGQRQLQQLPTHPGPRSNPPASQQAWHHQNPTTDFDQLFDFASFMWDARNDILGQSSPDLGGSGFGPGSDLIDPWPSIGNHLPLNGQAPAETSTLSFNDMQSSTENQARHAAHPSVPDVPVAVAEDHDLINYFVRTVVPPILAEVETQKRWSSMRQILVSMSNTSDLVRNAILAFAMLLYCRREMPGISGPRHHYQAARAKMIASCADGESFVRYTSLREQLLATIFFLSYVDILEDRMDSVLENLKRAYSIFQQGEKRSFRSVELRLLSWIRLLDARAVSAGGEGLFLSDNSEALIVHPSPTSAVAAEDAQADAPKDDVQEWDVEDVLFQVLYYPGIVFFQKVQSFMGRISKIDPWHRSRGTVEDETEVMQIASQILKDLRELYDDRPTLMDHAVDGRLTAPHVSANLAIAITRAFRTYLSNYYASKVHLHRVAYKHLPLSKETLEALSHIRRLTRLMVDSLEAEASLPVSQLWPLLMLGSEEQDLQQRAWIREQVLRMENVATNARITAQVLEEVQARQDTGKTRVDIRSVMHAIFDSCFAIV